jgi:hypothetical protein
MYYQETRRSKSDLNLPTVALPITAGLIASALLCRAASSGITTAIKLSFSLSPLALSLSLRSSIPANLSVRTSLLYAATNSHTHAHAAEENARARLQSLWRKSFLDRYEYIGRHSSARPGHFAPEQGTTAAVVPHTMFTAEIALCMRF